MICTVAFVSQVKLLFYYASNDVRASVRMKALSNLLRLATQLPHAWTQDMIQVGEDASL